MSARKIVLALAVTALAGSTAFATHDRFVGKKSILVTSFVPAYAACDSTVATLTHNAPLAFPACPAARISAELGFGPSGWGVAKLRPLLNSARQATDVRINVDLVDVRLDGGTGEPFNGTLTLAGIARQTDDYCAGGDGACTMIDLPGVLPFVVPPVRCGTDAVPALDPGRCHTVTTANLLLAGAVVPGIGANVEIQQLVIYHTTELAFVAGMFLP